MSATIITLGSPSYSFNDMDDYSGGDGSRRDRRRAKRGERKEKRTALRDARKSARGERKELRKENRGERKELRKEVRQTKKDIRKGVKPEEQASQEAMQEQATQEQATQDQATQEQGGQEQGGQEQGGQEQGGQEQGGQEQGGQEQGGQEQGSGGYSDEQSGSGYGDEGSGYGDEGSGYGDEGSGYGDEESGYGDEEGGYGDEEGGYDFDGDYNDFDGIQLEDYSEMGDSNYKKQSVKVNPAISDICNKIEWNKELCKKLEQSRDRYGNVNNLTAKIQERKRRIQNLENTLDNYQQNGLDYSSAEGDLVPSMRRSDGRPCPIKAKEVREARIRAKRRRKNRNMTPVSNQLNPEISNQRIVIPASYSNAAGTGLIALDDSSDYDSEELDVRMSNAEGETIELTSSLDGEKSTINWAGVVIGVGIGALSIYLMKKYKLI
jgi:hypothetical protein